MAGRGCIITITILPSTVNEDPNVIDKTQELTLPVALHSPLEVLREQIERLTSIKIADQVLILCDLTDPDRNNDLLLDGRNHMSLRDCGIRNGSMLTLHALGLSAEKRMALLKEAASKSIKATFEKPPLQLATNISAANANHSYNGIIFDIEVKGPFEIEVKSIFLSGMLGPINIFARDREWEIDNDDEPSQHWWAHRESLSKRGWTLVATADCLPSWDKPFEIMLNKPVTMLPHTKRGFYCHSSLPDDLGIQYQSFGKNDIVAEDDYIRILPGLGHTGSDPFDSTHGWYRAWRGPAGKFSYHAKFKGWTLPEHNIFPIELKQGIKSLLLCHYKCKVNDNYVNNAKTNEIMSSNLFTSTSSNSNNNNNSSNNNNNNNIRSVSIDMTDDKIEFCSHGEIDNDQIKKCDNTNVSINVNRSSSIIYNLVSPVARLARSLSNSSSTSTTPIHNTWSMSLSPTSNVDKNVTTATTTRILNNNIIYRLPLYVVYNILEFMHWDWFEDIRDALLKEKLFNAIESKICKNKNSRLVTNHSSSADHDSDSQLTGEEVTGAFGGIHSVLSTNSEQIFNLLHSLGLTTFGNHNYMDDDDDDDDNNEEDDEDNISMDGDDDDNEEDDEDDISMDDNDNEEDDEDDINMDDNDDEEDDDDDDD